MRRRLVARILWAGIGICFIVTLCTLFLPGDELHYRGLRRLLIQRMLDNRGYPSALEPYASHFTKRTEFAYPGQGYDVEAIRVDGFDRSTFVKKIEPSLKGDYSESGGALEPIATWNVFESELNPNCTDTDSSCNPTRTRIDIYDGLTPGHCFVVLLTHYRNDPNLLHIRTQLGFMPLTPTPQQLHYGMITPEFLEKALS